MQLEVFARKVLDFVNSQPIIVRLILLFFLFLFVVIPLAIPAAIFFLIKAAVQKQQHAN
ncbi:MAG: hypothetical protein AAB874_02530 [Patescibacteria group bacterium]